MSAAKDIHRAFIYLACNLFFLPIASSAYAYEIKGIDIELLAQAEETYDDNITFTKAHNADDFITTLSAGLTANYKGKLKSWEFIANAHRQIFAEEHNFDNTSEDITLAFAEELSKHQKINLKDVFTHTYEPVSFIETFGRTSGRYSYYMNEFGLEYVRELRKQLLFTARYANEINEFRRAGPSDSFQNKAAVQIDLSLNSAAGLLFLYEYSVREFNASTSASENTLAAGIKHYITKQLSLDLKAGVDFINSYTDKDYIKPLVSFSLTDEIDDKTSAKIEFLKESSKNPYIVDVFNSWRIEPSLTRQLWEKASFSILSFYGEGKYPESGINDRLAGAEVVYAYELTKRMKLNLSYSYSKIDSTDENREYKKNRVSLGLKMEL